MKPLFPFDSKAKVLCLTVLSLCCLNRRLSTPQLLLFPSGPLCKSSGSVPTSRPNPRYVSDMDSSGGEAAGQEGHLDLRSSPGRSDLSGLYHLGRTLGRGHFAVVKLARHFNTGQLVAVKMIDKTKLDVMATSHLLQEVRYAQKGLWSESLTNLLKFFSPPS